MNKESDVHFIYVNENEYKTMEGKLTKGRFSKKIKHVNGSQSLHAFRPVDQTTIKAGTISESTETKSFQLL